MSYKALYRKWRPETFDKVAGQDAVMTTLKNQISAERIGHAYLFCGTRGTGKTSAAKIFARAANCPNAVKNGGNPCNECEICESIKNGSSMNVFEIDAASNNGVDNIRDIREETAYPPVEGRYKVYIIDEVHMLSTGAFNALLKTLEEPPSYVIFILATTDPQKVPATILSRCQRYDFKRLSKKRIAEHLKEIAVSEGMDIEDKAISYVAEAADGSMRDALSILDQCMSYHGGGHLGYEDVLNIIGAADDSQYSKLYNEIISGNTIGALNLINELINAGTDIMQLINDMVWYLRNVLLAGSADISEDILDLSEDRLDMAAADYKKTSVKRLTGILGEFAELSNKARFAPQKRVLLEVLAIRLCLGKDINPEESIKPSAETSVYKDRGTANRRTAAGDLKEAPKGGIKDLKNIRENIQETSDHPVPRDAYSAYGGNKAEDSEAENLKDNLPAAGRTDNGNVIEILKSNWTELVSRLLPSNRPLFSGAILKEENGSIVLVFKNSMNFKLAANNIEENGVLKLRELASELLGQEVTFMARVARPGEMSENMDRATDEELSRINFHIDIED